MSIFPTLGSNLKVPKKEIWGCAAVGQGVKRESPGIRVNDDPLCPQDRMTMQYQDSGFSEEDADLQVTVYSEHCTVAGVLDELL
jgi:hypothetical protein